MNEPVILKGFGRGIAVILDSECDFEVICEHFAQKIINGKNFFSGNEVPVQFVGRRLSSHELLKLIDIMKTFGGVHDIIFPWDEIDFYNLIPQAPVCDANSNIDLTTTQIHKGTLRSGQIIKVNGDLVVFGDVNPGAEVIASSNIFVLGTLRGIAHAGFGGNRNVVVFALELKPVQIRIANLIARAPDDQSSEDVIGPEIAYIENDVIVIKPIQHFKV